LSFVGECVVDKNLTTVVDSAGNEVPVKQKQLTPWASVLDP